MTDLYNNQKSYKIELEEKILPLRQNQDDVLMQLKGLYEKIAKENSKIEKIKDLEKFDQNISNDVFSLELKLNSFQKDLIFQFTKYDKIYLENLFIPGIIGDNCKFQTMKEFVEVITI